MVKEHLSVPHLLGPNLDQFTGISRIAYVLFTRTASYGTVRNYYVSFK